MFVIGAVELAGRQDDHGRLAVTFLRRNRGQRLFQKAGIAVDRCDAVFHEKLREHPHHDFAVLQHVAHARRSAAIVLEHVELVCAGTNEVDADDMRIDAARRAEPDRGLLEGCVAGDQMLGDAPGLDDLATVVDIRQKGVQRGSALPDATVELAPFGVGEDPRKHVERDQALGIAAFSVDCEGDADALEQVLRLTLLEAAQIVGHGFVPAFETLVSRAHLSTVEHFIEHEVIPSGHECKYFNNNTSSVTR